MRLQISLESSELTVHWKTLVSSPVLFGSYTIAAAVSRGASTDGQSSGPLTKLQLIPSSFI